MPPKRIQPRAPAEAEIPLAHDAATWDVETFESDWDDEEAQLADELAHFADD